MGTARQIIRISALCNRSQLAARVDGWIGEGVTRIAIVGPGCEVVEDEPDGLIAADGDAPGRFIVTTAHPNESVERVHTFLRAFEPAKTRVEIVAL